MKSIKKTLFKIWTIIVVIMVAPAAIIHIWYQVWYSRHFLLKGINDLPEQEQKEVRERIRKFELEQFERETGITNQEQCL
jgi:hypothetical protein